MERKRVQSILGLVVCSLLVACNAASPQIAEVTRIVPQTVEVTRIVPLTIGVTRVATQELPSTSVPQLSSSTPVASTNSTIQGTSIPYNQSYSQGIILITQYYTFLGHGLYSDAYQLLSASFRQTQSEQDYLRGVKTAFKKVQINNIEPSYGWRDQEGPGWNPSSGDGFRFTVDIVAWGEGNMSGAVPSGQPQEFWITIVQENGDWTIDKFATA